MLRILIVKSLSFYFFVNMLTNVSTRAQCISGDCENGYGVFVYKDKSTCEGSWKSGKPEGKCKMFFQSGASFEGIMQDGKKNGYGKYVYANGSVYEGTFKDNARNGHGKYTSIDGYSEEGKYSNDTLNGNVTFKFSNGDKYVGYAQNNILNGTGIYYFVNGDKFDGIYKNGKRNGIGVLYYAKGGTLKGTWLNGEFVSGSNQVRSDKTKVILPVLSDNNVYEVNVLLNNVLKLDMIFDTGASEVYLTPDIVLTLIKTKTISEEDILEGGLFVDANGNVNKSIRFNMRKMKIAETTIENVTCAVSQNVEGLNLLGLSALRKLGKFEFDFVNTEITIK